MKVITKILCTVSGAHLPRWGPLDPYCSRLETVVFLLSVSIQVRVSNPTSASRLPLSRLGQRGTIPALVLPSGGMASRHRKSATVERLQKWSRHKIGIVNMPNSKWRKQRGGQPLTRKRSMKGITKSLGAVGATRLSGWGPHDTYCAWLETLQDMATNRCQWRSCCQFLSRLFELSHESWLYGSEVSVANTDVVPPMLLMMTKSS
ncbi:hypothetical protein T265_07176 [Opisthorchis viverrini]|uniref:Uncharacterized protein n=1 Tax=Opisthorchis viverrini TaxID=6198 RepID=A0A074ZHX5_OPIVI|nr:hypothetical protein T265_07176 [Opisthorchis viverrini]KER25377.1 hypothetical protein T265_07176 [Opisthorchis viverrini]